MNQNEEDGKWVNELNIGNKYEYYPLNIKENGLMIVKLYKTDYLSWGDEQFFASNRGGMNVFISLSDKKIEIFQKEIGSMGYKFQFITLAGFHAQNYAIFDLAKKYKQYGMAAYSRLQQQEFDSEKEGYTATKHQKEVGTSYFDAISNAISSGKSSTTAMKDSTETDQF